MFLYRLEFPHYCQNKVAQRVFYCTCAFPKQIPRSFPQHMCLEYICQLLRPFGQADSTSVFQFQFLSWLLFTAISIQLSAIQAAVFRSSSYRGKCVYKSRSATH